MIKIIEKEFLNDNFITKAFTEEIKLNDKLLFNKKDIYYFGNYKEEKINLIKQKLLRNKKRFIKAIENGTKFIICANSMELLNNSFNLKDINLYMSYNPLLFKKGMKNLKIKKEKKDTNIKTIDCLNKVINANNFRYKNLICISDEKLINKIIKKTKHITLSY